MELMFDAYPAPDHSLHEEVPADWPLLLVRAQPPGAGDPCSTRRRDVMVAMRDGSWEEAVLWAWTPIGASHPTRWRCQLEVGGHVSWYVHEEQAIRACDVRHS
jgi:hypothetical protein